MKNYAPVILRFGIAAVVLWFGTQQLMHPEMWTRLLPEWTSVFGVSQTTLIYMNGIAEIILGALLVLGIWVRFIGLVTALHLFHIAYTVGYGAIGVRDFGLAVSALAIFFNGSDIWSLDRAFTKKVAMDVNASTSTV